MTTQEFFKKVDFKSIYNDSKNESNGIHIKTFDFIKSDNFNADMYNAYIRAKEMFSWDYVLDINNVIKANTASCVKDYDSVDELQKECDEIFKIILLSYEKRITEYNPNDDYFVSLSCGLFTISINPYTPSVMIAYTPHHVKTLVFPNNTITNKND